MGENLDKKYAENLSALINATKGSKIDWRRQNPTTYYYEYKIRGEVKLITSIQKIFGTDLGFTFQIIDAVNKESLVVINAGASNTLKVFSSLLSGFTNPNIDLKSPLGVLVEELYYSTDNFVANKGIKAFDDLINNISNDSEEP